MRGSRQQAGIEQPGGQRDLGAVGQPAQLQVAPRGQLQPAVAQFPGGGDQHLPLGRGEYSGRDPHPRQPAVGCLVQPDRTRAAVLSAGVADSGGS
jgi:hypothetical protein